MLYIRVSQTHLQNRPFLKLERKSPPITLYSNFPLKGALFGQNSCVRNLILDWYF